MNAIVVVFFSLAIASNSSSISFFFVVLVIPVTDGLIVELNVSEAKSLPFAVFVMLREYVACAVG